MKRCAICRVKVRKTTTVWVKLDGTLSRARICAGCNKDTVRIHLGGVPGRCIVGCGELAICCGGCADKRGNKDRQATLKAAAKKLRGLAKGFDSDDHSAQERGEHLRMAADIVEAGAF